MATKFEKILAKTTLGIITTTTFYLVGVGLYTLFYGNGYLYNLVYSVGYIVGTIKECL